MGNHIPKASPNALVEKYPVLQEYSKIHHDEIVESIEIFRELDEGQVCDENFFDE